MLSLAAVGYFPKYLWVKWAAEIADVGVCLFGQHLHFVIPVPFICWPNWMERDVCTFGCKHGEVKQMILQFDMYKQQALHG